MVLSRLVVRRVALLDKGVDDVGHVEALRFVNEPLGVPLVQLRVGRVLARLAKGRGDAEPYASEQHDDEEQADDGAEAFQSQARRGC